MKLGDQQASGNVEDRRGIGIGGGLGVGDARDRGGRLFPRLRPEHRDQRGRAGRSPARNARGAQGRARRRDGAVRRQDPRQYRGRLGQDLPAVEQPVPPPDAGPLRRASALGLRQGAVGHGPVLLSRRREALHRPRVLPRPETRFRAPGRFRPGLCDRPRGRPPRAEAHRHLPEDGSGTRGARSRGRNATGLRAAWNCRPTATRACGATTRAA